MCVCARVRTCARDLVCVCFCHALYENVNFRMFCTLICIIMGICAFYIVFVFQVVKRFEFPKALYKFPILLLLLLLLLHSC